LASSTAEKRSRPVFVLTGTSGEGKSTLAKLLVERLPDELELAVSATTRDRRPGETDGIQYWFVTHERFAELLADDEFIEHVDHPWGQRVGTLRSEIDRIQRKGKVPMLDLETKGALAIQEQVPGAVTIFVKAPSFEELERRLRARATESGGEIDKRLARAKEQLEQAVEFDHVVVNDDVERAANELFAIVERELHCAGTMSRP
jgi:guanylate kinase